MADDQPTDGGAPPADTTSALTSDDAFAKVLAMETADAPEKEPPKEQQPEADKPTAEAEAQSEGTTDDKPAEGAEAPATAEPEAGAEEPELYVHGNAKTRLRDGTIVPIAELKKLPDRLKELERELTQAKAPQPEAEGKHAELVKQEQFLSQVLPIAIQAAQQAIPPEPNPSLRETDLIEYLSQKALRDEKLGQFQQLQAAQQEQQQKQTKAQQEAFARYVNEQKEAFFEERPELKDPVKLKEAQEWMQKGAKGLAFKDEEVQNIYDRRVITALEESAKWRAHLAEQAKLKPIVQAKTKDAPPVQKPGPRAAATDSKTQKTNELARQFDQRRDQDSAVAYLMATGLIDNGTSR
jgi:hypothetical protein